MLWADNVFHELDSQILPSEALSTSIGWVQRMPPCLGMVRVLWLVPCEHDCEPFVAGNYDIDFSGCKGCLR